MCGRTPFPCLPLLRCTSAGRGRLPRVSFAVGPQELSVTPTASEMTKGTYVSRSTMLLCAEKKAEAERCWGSGMWGQAMGGLGPDVHALCNSLGGTAQWVLGFPCCLCGYTAHSQLDTPKAECLCGCLLCPWPCLWLAPIPQVSPLPLLMGRGCRFIIAASRVPPGLSLMALYRFYVITS